MPMQGGAMAAAVRAFAARLQAHRSSYDELCWWSCVAQLLLRCSIAEFRKLDLKINRETSTLASTSMT